VNAKTEWVLKRFRLDSKQSRAKKYILVKGGFNYVKERKRFYID
jgi:hypothetical protein